LVAASIATQCSMMVATLNDNRRRQNTKKKKTKMDF